MSSFNIIILVIAVFGVIYLIRKKSNYQKPKHVAVVDPAAQEAYIANKMRYNENQNLTLEEKIKLSWQFLINLKKIIMEKFSATDRETLAKASEVLIKNGMNYHHDVEQELKVKLELSHAESMSKIKKQEHSVSL